MSPERAPVKLDALRLAAYQEVFMKQIILAAVLGAFTVVGFAGEGQKDGKKAESCKMECCAKNKTACKDCKDCKDKMAKPEKKG